MSTKKSINWSKIIGTTWNAVGDKTVKSVLSLAMKRLTNSLQEKFEVKQEQTEEVTTTLSSCISYMITQKVNERTIDVNYVSKMLQSNLIPTIASIASNNPKGDEIIQTISSYVSEFADNETLVTILDQFAGKEIIEQLQFTAKQIASLKLQDTNAETKEGIVAIEEEVETGLVKETVTEEVQIVEGNDLPQVKKK